ncbi:DNA-binding protein [Burkholderia sp. MBR-1]|uniref:DNA-binding protein n=1 Tax=Burkholderia sp. MBR-1 TaxID=2732364 RepID=UPI0015EF6D9A|nr:DNA-binding protein [Burkholderia sp. MBR-1]QMI49901.1 hypothetical protein MBR110_31060 [Burkholderia sp. MBR-1]
MPDIKATIEKVHEAVRQLLADAGTPVPANVLVFRKFVSVRKVRAQLGGGDPANISRLLKAVEGAMFPQEAPATALPGLPPAIAAQMQALWESAKNAQWEELERAREAAEARADAAVATATDAIARAQAAQRDAEARLELVEAALAQARAIADAQAQQLTDVQAQNRQLTAALGEQTTRADGLAQQLGDAHASKEAEIEAARRRYDGMAIKLQQDTDAQRQNLRTEREALLKSATLAEERARDLQHEVQRERDHNERRERETRAELAREREARIAAENVLHDLRGTLRDQHTELESLRRATRSGAAIRRRPARPAASSVARR